MKIALTGYSGMIGTYVKKNLSTAHEIINLDLRERENSLEDRHSMQGIAGIIHLASFNSNNSSIIFPEEIAITNKLVQILGYLKFKFCIFFRTSNIYGESFKQIADENCETNPISEYAKAKLKSEEILKSFCQKNEISLIILRLAPVISKKSHSNIGKLLRYLDREMPIPMLSSSNHSSKSYLTLENIIITLEAILAKMQSVDKVYQDTYNLGNSAPMSMISLIRQYCKENNLAVASFKVPVILERFLFNFPVLGNKIAQKFESSVISSLKLEEDFNISLELKKFGISNE